MKRFLERTDIYFADARVVNSTRRTSKEYSREYLYNPNEEKQWSIHFEKNSKDDVVNVTFLQQLEYSVHYTLYLNSGEIKRVGYLDSRPLSLLTLLPTSKIPVEKNIQKTDKIMEDIRYFGNNSLDFIMGI